MTVAPLIIRSLTVDKVKAAEEIWAKLGDSLDNVDLFHHQVMVVKFVPEKAGNIHLSDKSAAESKWQGKVGLVVKLGPTAFMDDENIKFNNAIAVVGDWVFYRSSDGYDVDVTPNGWSSAHIPCRILEDASIKGVLKQPDVIY